MFIQETEVPKPRLLTSMQIFVDERQYYKNLFSSLEMTAIKTIYVCYKLSDERINMLIFQQKCLTNILSFIVQKDISKSICLVKLVKCSNQKKQQLVFIFLGFNNGSVSIYQYDSKLLKLGQLRSDSRELPRSIAFFDGFLTVLRNQTIQFFYGLPNISNLCRVNTARMNQDICSYHLRERLYVSTYHKFQIFNKNSLFKEFELEDTSMMCELESQHSERILYAGTTEDTFKIVDFIRNEIYNFHNFKSFIVQIIENDDDLWILGMDGNMTHFTLKSQRIRNSLTSQMSSGRMQENHYNLKHLFKLHQRGILNAEFVGGFLVLMDTEGWLVIYELVPVAMETDRTELTVK